MLLKKLLPLILIVGTATAQPPQVDWHIVSVTTLRNLGAIVPPGTVDHVNVVVRPAPKRASKVCAVLVEVVWKDTRVSTKKAQIVTEAGAVVSIDIPAGVDPKPTSIVVSELSISAKPLEVKP